MGCCDDLHLIVSQRSTEALSVAAAAEEVLCTLPALVGNRGSRHVMSWIPNWVSDSHDASECSSTTYTYISSVARLCHAGAVSLPGGHCMSMHVSENVRHDRAASTTAPRCALALAVLLAYGWRHAHSAMPTEPVCNRRKNRFSRPLAGRILQVQLPAWQAVTKSSEQRGKIAMSACSIAVLAHTRVLSS